MRVQYKMLTDKFLINIAKSINGETENHVGYVTFSSTVHTPDSTDTSVAGELGSRVTATGARTSTGTEVTFNGLRSGAVASSSGDDINLIGLFDTASNGELEAEATVPSILHSDSFDLEVDWTINVQRRN